MKKRILAILTMLMLCLALMPGAAFADTDDKTLTVDASAQEVEGESYQTIQAAINYIYSQYKDAIVSHVVYVFVANAPIPSTGGAGTACT